jgi:hypothetical protein
MNVMATRPGVALHTVLWPSEMVTATRVTATPNTSVLDKRVTSWAAVVVPGTITDWPRKPSVKEEDAGAPVHVKY